MKLSVVGASSVATLQLGTALEAMFAEFGSLGEIELSLYARDRHRLKVIANQVERRLHASATVSSTTSLDDSLCGADVVLVQVRVGGLAAREFDETYPHRVGLPGEETLGPGGFANALRTVPVLDPMFSRIPELAPDALVVVLTNPAGIVRQAASDHGLNVIEVCEAPHALLGQIAEKLGCPMSDLFSRYVGLNHVGFYVPSDAGELEELVDLVPIDPQQVMDYGAVPLAYVRYYADPAKQYLSQRDRPSRAKELMAIDRRARDVLDQGGSPDTSTRPAPWYSLAFMPVLRSLLFHERSPLLVGAPNRGRLAGVANDVTIEGPSIVDDSGSVLPLALPDVPPRALDLLERHARYERLALAACREPSEEMIAQALRANPMVHDEVSIEVLLEVLAESSFVPTLSVPE